MKSVLKLAAVGCVGLAATLTGVAPASATTTHLSHHHGHHGHHGHHRSHPVFVQTDNPAGNRIVAYDRSRNGTLAKAGSYATGGHGGILGGSVVDHTASQGALAYSAHSHMMVAVNAGSNTITTFGVHGDRLARRQVQSSGGTFPVSVAVHGNLVYVLNARNGGSIQGYLSIGRHLVRIPQWHKNLGLNTSVTPEFVNTPGEIAFAPDGRRLIVTTKNASNSVEVFRLGAGGPGAATITSLRPGSIPFAASFDRAGHLDLVETGTGDVAAFTLNANDSLSQLGFINSGQAGTCWVAAVDGNLYLSNTGSNTVTGVKVLRNGELNRLGNTPTGAGPVDAAASSDGRYLYVQTGAAGGVDEFRINHDGSLAAIGSVTVPNAAGGEGIAAL